MPEFNATLIFVMISFAVFMLAMKAIYFDPILKLKYEREHKLQDDKDAAQRFVEEFERIHADYEAGLKKARKEAHQIIQEIRQQAKSSAQQALMEARTKAQAEMDRQMADLAAWRESTYRELENERGALTRTIIEKVTRGSRIQSARQTAGGKA